MFYSIILNSETYKLQMEDLTMKEQHCQRQIHNSRHGSDYVRRSIYVHHFLKKNRIVIHCIVGRLIFQVS